jgi:hypothetical protein
MHSLRLQTDLRQERFQVFHPASGLDITFQVMTFAGQSTCHQHTVYAVF